MARPDRVDCPHGRHHLRARHRPAPRRPAPRGWFAVAFASLAISVPADLFIMLVFTENCSQPPAPIDVLHGQVAMLVVLLVAALPWMVMLPWSRNRGHGLVIGLVALLPAIEIRAPRLHRRCLDELDLLRLSTNALNCTPGELLDIGEDVVDVIP